MYSTHGHFAAGPLHSETSRIGYINLFSSGKFEHQYIRVELQEIQKADMGRKYANVDRRPLDPPPVVLLRLFRVYNHGTDYQFEEEFPNYREVETMGIICSLDLFSVPESVWDGSHASGEISSHQLVGDHEIPYHKHPFEAIYYVPPAPSEKVLCYMQHHSVLESSQCNELMIGEKVAEPVLVDYMGRKALMFAFGDLAVKQVGTFILRYRIFNISSLVVPGMESSAQTELYGGPFKVYSTKDFPGLPPSTDLSKASTNH
ncbi:hypothetical protein DXG01_003339 [Tephrocybe rancida]|nr:hypothetical protein DXG01_003339 [Tephrocybe rancida]